MEAIEVFRFLTSLPLASTGRTKGGEKTQPFNRFHSRLFKVSLVVYQAYVFKWRTKRLRESILRCSDSLLGPLICLKRLSVQMGQPNKRVMTWFRWGQPKPGFISM